MADNIYDYDGRYEGEEIDDILDSVKDKVSKVEGKGLSTEDFTTALKNKLESLQRYDDTAISAAIAKLRNDFDTLVKSDTSGAIDKFNEIIAFLNGIEDSESLDSIIASIERQIAMVAEGAAKGQTSVQSVKVNGVEKKPVDGIVDLGNIDPAVDTYVADFNLYDVLAGTAVTIKEDFVEALRNNKVIIIPYRTFVVIATAQLQADEDSMIYISIQARISEQLIEVQFSCDTVPATVVGKIITTDFVTNDRLTSTLEAHTSKQKSAIIKEFMNVKPTVKIFHSTDNYHSMVYAYHPYCEQFGKGELVVMRYGRVKSPKMTNVEEGELSYSTKTGWRECLGAPVRLPKNFGSLCYERCNEPAKLSIGWSYYTDVVNDICLRATFLPVSIETPDGIEYFEGLVSMAQKLKVNTKYRDALQALQEDYYDIWETSDNGGMYNKLEWSIFGRKRERLELGVALRVLNPEFQSLLDDGKINDEQFRYRRWYYDLSLGEMIPKYLYSEVCEMDMTTGSISEMVSLRGPRCPRLTVKG